MHMAGWVMTGIFSLFMLGASAAPKLTGAKVAVDSMTAIGWDPGKLLLIGVIEATLTIMFLIPRTALLGAVLMTGLLGGALASKWRIDAPLFSHTLFGVYLGIIMWASLWLRDAHFRSMVLGMVKPA